MRSQRNSQFKPRSTSKRILIGIVSVSTLAVFSMGLSFADTDLKAKVRIWADQQAGTAVMALHQAIGSETEVQKARLQEELRLGLEQQAEEMNKFTEQQTQHYLDELRKHADTLIAGLHFSSEDDKAEMISKLEAITESAEQAMNHLENSYTPPSPVMEKTREEIKLPEPPAEGAETELPTVTEDVYSQEIK